MKEVILRKNLVDDIQLIAKNAGQAILEIYHSSDFGIELKKDDSPLTKADRTANQIIENGLEQLPENFPILSEENIEIPYSIRKDFEFFWMVDPLDGTKEFINKNDEFTVNIALIHKNKVVLGVVYIPVLDEMYFAEINQGAFSIIEGETLKLLPKPFNSNAKNLKVVCSKSHINEGTKKLIDQLNDPIIIAKGSSLKFIELAKGTAQLYPRVGTIMEWDSAAAQIIVEEAGGQIIDLKTGNPLIYNKENLTNPDFWATANVINTKISAVLITKNEEANIQKTIEQLLKVADEIIVIDTFSTDRTREICEQYGAIVYQRDWIGYAQNKNIGNQLASNEWILSIDADEVLSTELIDTINNLKLIDNTVYALDRVTSYCGKWIKHGDWYPDWKPRLFNKNHVNWQGNFVHETLSIPKHFNIRKIKGKLFHYSYKSKDEHIKRLEKYSILAAQDLFNRGKKANIIKIWISPFYRLFKNLIIKKGILDGRAGFQIAYQEAIAVHLKYKLLHSKK